MHSVEYLSDSDARSETMILGLRLVQEGVSRPRFKQRFGQTIEWYYGSELAELQSLNMIQVLPEKILLTTNAKFLGNQVFRNFV